MNTIVHPWGLVSDPVEIIMITVNNCFFRGLSIDDVIENNQMLNFHNLYLQNNNNRYCQTSKIVNPFTSITHFHKVSITFQKLELSFQSRPLFS